MKTIASLLTLIMLCTAVACSQTGNSTRKSHDPIEFPYQSYLDAMSEGDDFPTIGEDGDGFRPICPNIRYLAVDSQGGRSFVDSLALYYNTSLAFNTAAYDLSTVSRYFDGDKTPFINGFEGINLDGIQDPSLKEALRKVSLDVAGLLRKDLDPSQEEIPSVAAYFDLFNPLETKLLINKLNDEEIDMKTILPDYEDIHAKAMKDSIDCHDELLALTLREQDFLKKCAYARELANSCYTHEVDREQLIAVIDPLLRSGEYSPLLRQLWLAWRACLQLRIFSGMSNDSPMYNLVYNDMRNTVAATYLTYLQTHPDDAVALKEFACLAREINVVRDRGALLGNNCILDEMTLYAE